MTYLSLSFFLCKIGMLISLCRVGWRIRGSLYKSSSAEPDTSCGCSKAVSSSSLLRSVCWRNKGYEILFTGNERQMFRGRRSVSVIYWCVTKYHKSRGLKQQWTVSYPSVVWPGGFRLLRCICVAAVRGWLERLSGPPVDSHVWQVLPAVFEACWFPSNGLSCSGG